MFRRKEKSNGCSWCLPTVWLLGLSFSFIAENCIASGHTRTPAVVTVSNTVFYFCENETLRIAGNVPACSVLEKVPAHFDVPCGDLYRDYWCVQSPFSGTGITWGFVLRLNCFDLNKMRQRVLEGLPEDFDPQFYQAEDHSVPKVILLSDPRMVIAWKELVPVIAWNESQPLEKRLPEPFFARAQIWTAVGNHTEALSDFLEASSLIRTNNRTDLLQYARYFTFLETALSRESNLPGKPYIARSRKYWGMGMNAYRTGRIDQAVFHFTDAVRLNPSMPVNWYCRALSYKRLGLDEKAERDARLGVAAENHIAKSRGWAYAAFIGRDLSVYQGGDRYWLEQFRKGDGIAWKRYK